jgi:hypothetical protein
MDSPNLQGGWQGTVKAGRFFMLAFLLSLVGSIFFPTGREKQTFVKHTATGLWK